MSWLESCDLQKFGMRLVQYGVESVEDLIDGKVGGLVGLLLGLILGFILGLVRVLLDLVLLSLQVPR